MSSNTRNAEANVADAWVSFGSRASFVSRLVRSAALINLVFMSTENTSSASSTAEADRLRTAATSVAVRRGASRRAMAWAFADSLSRASASSWFAGTAETSTAPTPVPDNSETRCSASVMDRPDTRVGPRRSRSSSENREPSGTANNPVNRWPSSASASAAAWCSAAYNCWLACSRCSDTSRASTLAPGNSTRFARSHATTASNNAFADSTRVHARADKNSATSSAASAKSRQPHSLRISAACSHWVACRCA